MNDSLFQFLFEEAEQRPMTVSELNAEVKVLIERGFARVWVEGEVVDFRRVSTGHWYFTLNDGSAQVKCVCWSGTNFRIRFRPENGMTVRIRGRLTFWEGKGELKLNVDSLEPSGEGALRAAFEQIKARLDAEGLFAEELKRPIPYFPRRVAVVTSKNGAAFHDIHTVLTRRARSVSLLLVNAVVQGEGSAMSIRRAIEAANLYSSSEGAGRKIDVLIVGRGGGAAEDLWAFNDELLARAIRMSEIPVISAVGHEIDWTIADLVADVRAATPSAAAEIVAGREEDIVADLQTISTALTSLMEYKVLEARSTLSDLTNRLESRVGDVIQDGRDRLEPLLAKLSPAVLAVRTANAGKGLALLDSRQNAAMRNSLDEKNAALYVAMAKLDALSPLSVLARGYSITRSADDKVVRDASTLTKGDKLKITLQNGKLNAEVISTE